MVLNILVSAEFVPGTFDLDRAAQDRLALLAKSLTQPVALRLTHCIGKRTGEARKAGASQDEIVQTVLVVGLQAGTSLLHLAYEGIVEK